MSCSSWLLNTSVRQSSSKQREIGAERAFSIKSSSQTHETLPQLTPWRAMLMRTKEAGDLEKKRLVLLEKPVAVNQVRGFCIHPCLSLSMMHCSHLMRQQLPRGIRRFALCPQLGCCLVASGSCSSTRPPSIGCLNTACSSAQSQQAAQKIQIILSHFIPHPWWGCLPGRGAVRWAH